MVSPPNDDKTTQSTSRFSPGIGQKVTPATHCHSSPHVKQVSRASSNYVQEESPTKIAFTDLMNKVNAKPPEIRRKYASLISKTFNDLGNPIPNTARALHFEPDNSSPLSKHQKTITNHHSHPPIDNRSFHFDKKPNGQHRSLGKSYSFDLENAGYCAAYRQKQRLKKAYLSTGNLQQRRYTLYNFLNDPSVRDEALSVIYTGPIQSQLANETNIATVSALIIHAIRNILGKHLIGHETLDV